MECGVVRTKHRSFIPDISTNPPGVALPRTAWLRLNCLRIDFRHSTPAYATAACPLLRLVSVAQMNTPFVMLSFPVQSIDLLTECVAWRFCMTRQSNGCSTPDLCLVQPSSGIQELPQTMKKNNLLLSNLERD